MTDRKLYIDEQLIELYDGEPIGLTLRANELGAVGQLQAGFSNRFNVPKTAGNRRILADAEQVNHATALPYTELAARYFQDGVPILQRGRAILEEVTKDYVLSVYGQNFNLIEWLGDKKLSDIDFSGIDHINSLANVVTGSAKATEYVYAIGDYGLLSVFGNSVNVRALPPCLYVRWLFDQIFADAPFTLQGDLVNDTFFNRLVIDLNRLATNYFIGEVGNRNAVQVTYGPNDPAPPFYSYFDVGPNLATAEVVLNIGSAYQQTGLLGPRFFECQDDGTFEVEYTIDYEYTTGDTGREISFDFGPDQVDGSDRQTVAGIVNERNTVSGTISLERTAGERIYLRCVNEALTVGSDTLEIFSASYKIRNITNPLNGQTDFAASVHDMTQADLVKNIFGAFGVVPGFDEIRQVLTVDYLQNKIAATARATATDWTEKIDFSREINIRSRIDGFAQSNLLAWGTEATDIYNSQILTTTGQFLTTADATLPAEATLFESDFAASLMGVRLQYFFNVAQLPKYTDEGSPEGITQTAELDPRLLYVVPNAGDSISFTDGSTSSASSTVRLLKFADFADAEHLSFSGANNLIDRQFAALRDGVLIRPKVVRAYFKLSEPDVYSLELPAMVYLNCISEDYTINGYFYVNKIEDYTAGLPALVELIRVL